VVAAAALLEVDGEAEVADQGVARTAAAAAAVFATDEEAVTAAVASLTLNSHNTPSRQSQRRQQEPPTTPTAPNTASIGFQPAAAVVAAGAAAGLPYDALSGHVVTLRIKSVPVLTSAAFIQLTQASTSTSTSTSTSIGSSSSSSGAVLRLGAAVQGRADAGSWFQDVLLAPQGLPVVVLLEGLQVAKELK
jgi:hypothetical protein